jgi:hypothetical protein
VQIFVSDNPLTVFTGIDSVDEKTCSIGERLELKLQSTYVVPAGCSDDCVDSVDVRHFKLLFLT